MFKHGHRPSKTQRDIAHCSASGRPVRGLFAMHYKTIDLQSTEFDPLDPADAAEIGGHWPSIPLAG